MSPPEKQWMLFELDFYVPVRCLQCKIGFLLNIHHDSLRSRCLKSLAIIKEVPQAANPINGRAQCHRLYVSMRGGDIPLSTY